MLTKPQKQIKSFLQHTALVDLGVAAIFPVTGWLISTTESEAVFDQIGLFNNVNIFTFLIVGLICSFIYLVLLWLCLIFVVSCLAVLVYSPIIKIQLFRLVRKNDTNVANFVFKMVIATFVTTVLGTLGIGYLLHTANNEFLYWSVIVLVYALEGLILLASSLWSGTYKDTDI